MLSLYEILKASKTGIAPDLWTALAGMNWGGKDSGHEVKELTGIPPLSFTADGTPLLDYLISGNMSQTGTPTPDNPITPQGCGERTGNLIDIYANNTSNGYVNNALLRSDGSVYSPSSAYISEYLPIEDNTTYTYYTGGRTGVAQAVCFYNAVKEYISGTPYDSQTAITFTTPQGTKYYRCTVMRTASDTESYKKAMLNTGSTALPYEPYGYKLDISSANTTTPIYLGEVETTRRIKKLVLTGEEDITVSGAYYNVRTGTQKPISRNGLISTHFIAATGTISIGTCRFGGTEANPNDVLIVNYDNGSGGLDNFKSYLSTQYAAGTPVTVWYVLENEETGVVNEPLRKIGNYADTLSMEQAGVSIPTNNGSTTVDVETTLKPSDVYIKYKG